MFTVISIWRYDWMHLHTEDQAGGIVDVQQDTFFRRGPKMLVAWKPMNFRQGHGEHGGILVIFTCLLHMVY